MRRSITFWMSDVAVSGWYAPRGPPPGGQLCYSDLVIETTLMCDIVFHQPLRQTEGLMASLFKLLRIDLPVPDHTTLCRRCAALSVCRTASHNEGKTGGGPVHVLIDSTGLKIYGSGQWLEEKHGVNARRQWRKLHLDADADTGEIISEVLTDQNTSDISQIHALLKQIDIPIAIFTGDGAYESDETYKAVRRHRPGANSIIPPRMRALQGSLDQRDWHTNAITQHGRMRCQRITGYCRRAKAETAMGRYKYIIGCRLRSRKFANQQTEIILGCRILNQMMCYAHPDSVRVKKTTA